MKPYDEIEIEKTSNKKIQIIILDSPFSNIPVNPKQNTGGIPALLIQKKLNLNCGFKIKIKKGIPLSGGMGSSAATAAGVVFGINKLLDNVLTENEMIKYALEGEKISSYSPHLDNIGPCLLGGLILVRQNEPPDLIKLPIGPFYIALLHPKIKIDTKLAREILPEKIPLNKAVQQWANISALTFGFTVNDKDLIKSSMKDIIIEPIRSKLIQGYNEIRNSAINSGAIGSSISGSGPTIFALCSNEKKAKSILKSMKLTADQFKLSYHIYVSSINHSGPVIVK